MFSNASAILYRAMERQGITLTKGNFISVLDVAPIARGPSSVLQRACYDSILPYDGSHIVEWGILQVAPDIYTLNDVTITETDERERESVSPVYHGLGDLTQIPNVTPRQIVEAQKEYVAKTAGVEYDFSHLGEIPTEWTHVAPDFLDDHLIPITDWYGSTLSRYLRQNGVFYNYKEGFDLGCTTDDGIRFLVTHKNIARHIISEQQDYAASIQSEIERVESKMKELHDNPPF